MAEFNPAVQRHRQILPGKVSQFLLEEALVSLGFKMSHFGADLSAIEFDQWTNNWIRNFYISG